MLVWIPHTEKRKIQIIKTLNITDSAHVMETVSNTDMKSNKMKMKNESTLGSKNNLTNTLKNRMTAIMLTLSLGASSMALPLTAAHASEEGKRNTALALGAAAAALLLTQKNKTPGLVVAGAAVLAYGATQRHHDRDYRGHEGGHYYNGSYNDAGYQNADYRNHDGSRYQNDNYQHSDNYRNHDQSSYHSQDNYHNQDNYRNQDSYRNQNSSHYQNSNSGQSSYHNQERQQSNAGANNNGSGNGYHQTENSDGRTARKSR